MQVYRLDKKGGKKLILDKVYIACSFFSKFAGLIFKKPLNEKSGMILKGCNSIHTFWMRYSIDLLFIDNEGQVIHIIQEMKPFRFSPLIKKACSVLELKSGTSKKTGIAEGDKLLIR